MTKVLMLSADSSLLDGINRHILTMATAINNLDGFEVAVCVVRGAGDLTRELNKKGVTTYCLYASSGHNFRVLWRFLKVLNEYKPDIIHIHNFALMQRFVLSWFWHKSAIVQTVHGISDPIEHVSFRHVAENLSIKISPIKDLNRIYISKGVRDYHNEAGDVIYNPVEVCALERSDLLHKELGISLKSPIIGTACRFAEVKQPVKFVEVMCRVLEKIPESHAVLIGDGSADMKAKMRDEAIKYNVGNRLHWMGYRKDAANLVGELAMMVMTSKREGLPTAILEAMSRRTPVAFLKGDGGLVDLDEMNSTYGEYALIGSTTQELSDKIIESLHSPMPLDERIHRAMQVVKKYFSIEIVTAQLANYYIKILKGGSS